MKIRLICLSAFLINAACGGPAFVDTSKLPDTYQCNYMKDVCKEAREYERSYARMSEDEKKEFKTLLDSYRSQCNDALKACQKSK